MKTVSMKSVPISITVPSDTVKRIDRLAQKAGLNRSQFVCLLVETTIESEEPLINFALELGKAADAIWGRERREAACRQGTPVVAG